MSFDLERVRVALIEGVAPALKVTGYSHMSGAQKVPFIVPGYVGSIGYAKDFGGSAQIILPVVVVAGPSGAVETEKTLDAICSIGNPRSMYSAVRALDSLPSKPWRSCTLEDTDEGYYDAQFGEVTVMAVAFSINIYA